MASAVDSRLAYARLSAVATASRLPTATRGSNNSYTTSWDTTRPSSTGACNTAKTPPKITNQMSRSLCYEKNLNTPIYFDDGQKTPHPDR